MIMGSRLLQLYSCATALTFLLALSLDSTLAFTGMTAGNKQVLHEKKLRMMHGSRHNGTVGNNAFSSNFSSRGVKNAGVTGRQLFVSPNYHAKRNNKNVIYHSLWMKTLWLKQKIQYSKAVMTKFVAFSLMYWSMRPNQALAAKRFKVVESKEYVSSTQKKNRVPTVIIGSIVGFGATSAVINIKNRKDDNANNEGNKAKFEAIMKGGKKLDETTSQKVEKSNDDITPAEQKVIEEKKKALKSIEDKKIQKVLLEQQKEVSRKKAARAAAKIAEEEAKAKAAAKIAEEEARAKAAAKIAEEEAKAKSATRIAKEEAKAKVAAKIAEEEARAKAAVKIAEEEARAKAAAAAEEDANRIAEEERIRADKEAAAKYAEEVEAMSQKAKEAAARDQQRMVEQEKEKEEEMARAKQAKLEAAREAEMMAPSTQPKPEEFEQKLADKYVDIEDVGERAFTILVDLNMVSKTPDPDDPNYDNSLDNDPATGN